MQVRLLLVLALVLAGPASAAAMVELAQPPGPVPGNPADRLAHLPIEDSAYERASVCTRKRRPGMDAFHRWLTANARGDFWGVYRCEKWGKGQASLHAEGRALDWHLDAARRGDRREAARVVGLLLAPDRAGNPQALARRMGLQEIIWDCGYWGAGMPAFKPYAACFDRKGRPRKGVSATVAHRDHIHFGFTRAGARGETSFWRR
jgi:hypothetical protein